jgi:hypothetical protein
MSQVPPESTLHGAEASMGRLSSNLLMEVSMKAQSFAVSHLLIDHSMV